MMATETSEPAVASKESTATADDTARPLETGWRADTPVDDNLTRAFVWNQGEVNEFLALACGGRTDRPDGVFLADARSAIPYYNQAILTRPVLQRGDGVLDEVESFFAGSPRVCTLLSMWPTPDLASRGWQLVGHPAFVVRPAGSRVGGDDAPGVAIRTVESIADLAAAERVAIEGYPIDEARDEPTGSVLPPELLGSDLSIRLGLLDGAPVAIGNSCTKHGVVNLCLGATLPSARRRGVWEALVWARVGSAPDSPAVAYTSDYSRPGFQRMGFLVVSRFTLWARPPRR
jgi:hypothetical protein